ncbi:proton-conducting membrane transporter [Halomarina salina]|uniref:Proton-conducting membrane transporter n=1 Tax=Halomarina salina TaxID=1872699 RepID=A0ABD5RJ37_9EURY
MTSRPRLHDNISFLQGLAAVALFAVLTLVFLTSSGWSAPAGFPDGSVTASIGYAMFDLTDQAAIESEPFLVAFEIIDLVLVAALVAAVMLAKREGGGGLYGAARKAIRTDGGREDDD